MKNKGRLIVFSAPSGCGKGTMLAEILKDESFRCSVSATTRKPREGEVEGVNYYYITNEEFEARVANGEFLEHAGYCDHYYGSLLSEVDPYLEKGINVILEIEVQGAMKVRESRPDALLVFIAPPSVEELARRLHGRGDTSEEMIQKRLAKASIELADAPKFDYIITNDDLPKA